MAFNDNFKQSHFVLYELVLPYCTLCTPVDGLTEKWHTPVTCDESSDNEYSLWFSRNTAPTMAPPEASLDFKSVLNSKVFRVVQSGTETTPLLKPGEGMASRGTMSVSMTDFEGDPGPINFSDNGTFFGKLAARNILEGKKIITHYYSIFNEKETEYSYKFDGVDDYIEMPDIVLSVGDKIRLKYIAPKTTGQRVFISNLTTGAPWYYAYDGVWRTFFSGSTATLDGVPLSNGDPYPIDGKEHTLEITFTNAFVLSLIGKYRYAGYECDFIIKDFEIIRGTQTDASPNLRYEINDGWSENPVIRESYTNDPIWDGVATNFNQSNWVSKSVYGDKVEEVSTSTHYITSSALSGGKFTIKAKDALKGLEAFSEQFPIVTEAELTADIDDSTTTIPVSDGSLFTAGDVIIIDSELMLIDSISSNDLTVYARGTTYLAGDGEVIYKTKVDDHSDEASVQICYVMSKTFLSDVLEDIFNAVGLGDYVDSTQWFEEITEWNSNAYLYGVFYEPESVDDLINMLLTDYMIDMWLDQPTQKAYVSAVSTWKKSITTLSEETDITDVKTTVKEDSRYSRAYIYNKKEYQAESDDAVNYSRLTLYKDEESESDDFYGSESLKVFDPSPFITTASAEILTSRYVQRFSRTPETLTFTAEERKLAGINLGDIVDVVSRNSQTASGTYLNAMTRAQIIQIKPNLNKIGRTYNVKALSYVPLISSGGGDLTIFVSGTVYDINLYTRAGAPNTAVDITFVFQGVTVGSTDKDIPAIKAGNFDAGSTIKLIFTNNSKISAVGGSGGDAYVDGSINFNGGSAGDGGDGGVVYQSDGITTSMYLNYGEVDGYTTSSELYAPGGGGGGAAVYRYTYEPSLLARAAASSGSGGSGIPAGAAGVATSFKGSIAQGFDGTFAIGGPSSTATDSTVSAIGGEGGSSCGGAAGAKNSSVVSSLVFGYGGAAGAAIKGTGVTVYCLAADADKFKDGNSDSYTLIDV